MKKKVIHIINSLDMGGTETALYRLLCAMNSSEYTFSVIVLGKEGYYSTLIKELKIPVYYLTIKKTSIIKTFYQLGILLRQIKPDIVQTWLYHSDLIGGVSARFCGVKKIIWGIRCEGVGLKKSTKVIQKLCALLSWIIPDFIITNSQIAANNHRRIGYNPKKMQVIPNGFDTARFSSNKGKTLLQKIGNTQLPHDAILIGSLARFHKDKDYPSLIQAIDAVCKVHQNIYFVLCGPGCHYDNPALTAMISTLDHQDRVILIDGVDNSAAYLNALDIFVLTSKTEAFPNSLAEAMLCELPCIATDVGEVREIIGNTGLLIPSEDPKQIAAAALAMLNKSESERRQLGALARNRVEKRYSMEKNQTKMNDIYAR